MAASSQGAAAVPLRPPQPPLPSGNGSDAGVAAEAGNPKMDVERFRHRVDEYICKADEVCNLEQKVNEVVEYYANRKQPNNSKGNSGGKDKDKKKPGNSGSNNSGNKLIDGSRKEAVCTKRMQELMRQFDFFNGSRSFEFKIGINRKGCMEHSDALSLLKLGATLQEACFITQHKWARPFMNPVDVKGLGLDDYYEVIKKPMDFGTIKNQMEAKDGNGYKNVREIYADVRLVFTNAMTYNDDRSDIHVMAKTLLDKFEEKWLQLLPKVVEEEARQKDEEAQALANMQIAREAGYAKIARDTNSELDELNVHLEELRKLVIQKCRKTNSCVFFFPMKNFDDYFCILNDIVSWFASYVLIIFCNISQIHKVALFADLGIKASTHENRLFVCNDKAKYFLRKMSAEEKRKLGVGLSALSPDDLNKALEIFAEDNPNFQTTGDVVDVDMDAQPMHALRFFSSSFQATSLIKACNTWYLFLMQSEITLWKVKFFVKGALELQAKNCASKADDNLKRKKEICDALAKTARKRNKKLSSL
ncbi:unnamed protein product [Musa textilis]